MSPDRSRTPHGQEGAGVFLAEQHEKREKLEGIPEEEGLDSLEVESSWDPEEDVGNALDLSAGSLGIRKQGETSSETVRLGCFEWQRPPVAWEAVPCAKQLGETSRVSSESSEDRHLAYFVKAVEERSEVFEIALDIQPRDVHKVKTPGGNYWVINEKPKKRAEVGFRSLDESDKLDFLRAMKSELGSYLEHEAVEIAKRHNVPPERILGMKWVLTWKAIENEQGQSTGQKPKARLIIKGYQDTDLLLLRRDSPTLSTQNRNLLPSLTAAHRWRAYVGDIKTAFLNGDSTEYQRRIYADPLRRFVGCWVCGLTRSSES